MCEILSKKKKELSNATVHKVGAQSEVAQKNWKLSPNTKCTSRGHMQAFKTVTQSGKGLRRIALTGDAKALSVRRPRGHGGSFGGRSRTDRGGPQNACHYVTCTTVYYRYPPLPLVKVLALLSIGSGLNLFVSLSFFSLLFFKQCKMFRTANIQENTEN